MLLNLHEGQQNFVVGFGALIEVAGNLVQVVAHAVELVLAGQQCLTLCVGVCCLARVHGLFTNELGNAVKPVVNAVLDYAAFFVGADADFQTVSAQVGVSVGISGLACFRWVL